MSVLKFKKVSSDAFVPVRATPLSAGLDLFSPLDFTIAPQSKLIINTGLQVEIPGGSFLKIEARSSLALNYSILCGAGVINEDYRGEVKILLFNISNKKFEIKRGDRIAQMICHKIEYPSLIECTDMSIETVRGTKGFGSS